MRTFRIVTFFLTLLLASATMVAKANDAPPPPKDKPHVVTEGNQWYMVWGEERSGPFTYANTDGTLYHGHPILIAQDEDRLWHVYWGEVHHGPYEDLMVEGVYDNKLLFYYRLNKKYYVKWGANQRGPFSRVWRLDYGDDGLIHFIGKAGNVTTDIRWDGE